MTGPDRYAVPLHRALTQPILLGGVPRQIAIINGTITAVTAIGLKIWWLGIPIGLAIHAAACWLCKRDPRFFDILPRYFRLPPFLDS